MDILTELAKRFQAETNCSAHKAQEYTQQYIDLVAEQILKHLSKAQDGMVYIDRTYLHETLNTIMVKGKRDRKLTIFDKLPGRLFTVVQQGNNVTQKLTKIKMNYTLEEILVAHSDHKELVKHLYADFADEIMRDEVDWIKIDLKSIESFIKGNMDVDRSKLTEGGVEKYNSNLFHALRIKLIAEHFNGTMPNVIATSNFARKYYKGPNLQNVNSQVRTAALGDCYEYDIESSVFAWKYSWYKKYVKEMDYNFYILANTDDYLRKKNAIRRLIAKDVFDTEDDWAVKLIKTCITAIGFGAPLKVVGYAANGKYEPAALNTIITAKSRLEKFVNHPWVQVFYSEQQTINQLIMEQVKATGEDEHLKTIPELVNSKNVLKPKSVVSYKYQQAEREILDWLVDRCQEYDVLLTVHDCIYTRNKMRLLDIRLELAEFGDFYKISEEKHMGFSYDPYLKEHRERIAEEEAFAKGYKGQWADSGRINAKGEKVKIQVDLYTGEHNDFYDGSGYDGQNHYDSDLDPFLEDLSEDEKSEYRLARQAVLKPESDLPDWYKKV